MMENRFRTALEAHTELSLTPNTGGKYFWTAQFKKLVNDIVKTKKVYRTKLLCFYIPQK